MTHTLYDLDHRLIVRGLTLADAGERRLLDCAKNGDDFAVCKMIPTGEYDNRDHEIVRLDPDADGPGDYVLASRKPGRASWERTVVYQPLCASREEAEQAAYTEAAGVEWLGGNVVTDEQFDAMIADATAEARETGEGDILRVYGLDALADEIEQKHTA